VTNGKRHVLLTLFHPLIPSRADGTATKGGAPTSQLQVAGLEREEASIVVVRSFGALRQPQDDSKVARSGLFSAAR
jgi:hypothetical protein